MARKGRRQRKKMIINHLNSQKYFLYIDKYHDGSDVRFYFKIPPKKGIDDGNFSTYFTQDATPITEMDLSKIRSRFPHLEIHRQEITQPRKWITEF